MRGRGARVRGKKKKREKKNVIEENEKSKELNGTHKGENRGRDIISPSFPRRFFFACGLRAARTRTEHFFNSTKETRGDRVVARTPWKINIFPRNFLKDPSSDVLHREKLERNRELSLFLERE